MRDQAGRVVLLRPLRERELAIKTFLRLGVEIVIADEIGSDLVGFADRQIPVQSIPGAARSNDLRQLENAVCDFHDVYPLDAVITTLDYLLPSMGRINDRLGLRGLSEAVGRTCFDKRRQREAFREQGVPSARFRAVETLEDARVAGEELGYPFVLKPTDMTGSRGVVRVDSPRRLAGAYEATASESWAGSYLAEEYLPGDEISVETVTTGHDTQPIAVTAKLLGSPPHFVELGCSVPGVLSADVEQRVADVVRRALAAVGVRDTVAHTELRLTPDGPRVVEVNARIAGGLIADMLAEATGTNLYQVQWSVLTGGAPLIHRTPRYFLAQRALTGGHGRLVEIDLGKLPAWDPREYGRIQTFVGPGTSLHPVEHSNDVRGFVVARGPDPEAAASRADALTREIRLRCEQATDPFDGVPG